MTSKFKADAAPRLVTRKLAVDLKKGFGRHWHGGDAFKTQFFNALSMSFPVGEQFFIDSVRQAADHLPMSPESGAMKQLIAGFIGQEATHRFVHGLYNEQLDKQGLANHWQGWAESRLIRLRSRHPDMDVRHALAATCAYEHLTALLADGTLRYSSWLEGAEPEMQAVWLWHAAEETEHNAVAFDLYTALEGSYLMRVRWYVYVCLTFAWDVSRQTALNLRRDRSLWRTSTWLNAAKFAFGRDGLAWRCARPLLSYLKPGFHPGQDVHEAPAQLLASRWLNANSGIWRAVGHYEP